MRRIRTLAEFSTCYREWKESGLPVRDYCSNISYSESQFYRWKKRYEESHLRDVPEIDTGGFVPVRLSPKDGRLEMSTKYGTAREGAAPRIELTYPNGVTIRLSGDIPIETLRSMVLIIR